MLPVLTVACGTSRDADEKMSSAELAIGDGEYDKAQAICNSLFSDKEKLDETELGRLSILYMRLSEHCFEDENIAAATQCFRDASRLSDDSLNAFFSTLQLEDQRHFVLLKRIGSTLDNPIDMSEKLAADTIADEAHFE